MDRDRWSNTLDAPASVIEEALIMNATSPEDRRKLIHALVILTDEANVAEVLAVAQRQTGRECVSPRE
jgi:hypothetical protein